MVDTANAFHEKLPGSEVSADVGIYPEYEFRNMTMNYTAMGEAMDYLFIMGYDGEFWDNVQCINPNSEPECSNACAPMQSLIYGVESYIKLGVDPKKLYLGLPWYGIKYEFVKKIPFQTGQIDISEIQALQRKHLNVNITIDTKSMTKILDCVGLCEYDSIKNKEWYSQIWYDDEETLAPKYKLAKDYGLKGVGMWQASGLVYTDGLPADIMQGKKIWGSMCQ
jgi:di-N-acetylchitobiase